MATMFRPKIVEFGWPGNRSRRASSLAESAALYSMEGKLEASGELPLS